MLNAALTILEHKLPHPPVTFFLAVQEEIGLWGVRNVKAGAVGQAEVVFQLGRRQSGDGLPGGDGGVRAADRSARDRKSCGSASGGGGERDRDRGGGDQDLQTNGWHGLIVKGKQTGTSNLGIIQGGDARRMWRR